MYKPQTNSIQLSNQIDRIDNISREDFQRLYMKPQKPLIIKHLFGKNSKVYKWSFNHFFNELRDLEVGVFDDENEKQQDAQSYKKANLKMKFGDYLQLIQDKPTTKRLFLFNVFKHKKELHNDFKFPNIADKVLAFFPLAFFGGKGAITRIHRDMDNSCVFLTELVGYKRIVLFEPKYSTLLYQYPFSTHTSIDINNPDFEKYPGLKYIKGFELILEPGDTIFMPAGWWHHIEYNTACLGFAVRSLSPNLKDRLLGIWQVGIMTHIDEVLIKFFNQKWLNWKKEKVIKNAQKEIKEFSHS